MSSSIQSSRIPPFDGHDTRALPQHYSTAFSSNPNDPLTSDSDSEDWLQQELRNFGRNDARLRTFLADYDQCKNARREGLFQSMVAASYFEPPSSSYYWGPTNIIGGDTERSQSSKSPTFSQALDQFRAFLQRGKPGCARFWSDAPLLLRLAVQRLTCYIFSILSSSDDHSIPSKAFPFSAKLFATVAQLQRKYMVPLAALSLVVNLQWQLSDNVIDDCIIGSETKRKELLVSSRRQQPLHSQ